MNKQSIVRNLICALGVVVFFLVLSYGFMPQLLSGKVVNQSDISGWQGMSHEMMEWNAQHPDDQTAWTGSMFSGMPTAAIQSSTRGDWTQKIYNLLLTGKRPATYLFISLLGAFLMMLALGISPLLAVGGAIAVSFCAYNIQIIQVGHNTKMQAIAFAPWVLAALVFTYHRSLKGKRWLSGTLLGAALFGLALSLQVKANHPQITYYLAIIVAIYCIVELVSLLRSKDCKGQLVRFATASGLLLVLGLAGVGTNAIRLLPTWEYTQHSMRGGSTASSAGEGSKGLELDYATAWSYGWQELPNLMIPNFNGGSSACAVKPSKSATYDLLRQAGQSNAKQICEALPMYWGPQPFTAGPMYMGAITVFLFVLGLMLYRRKERWWLVAATAVAVLLALGSHFMWFTRLWYDYAPLYKKFRTVSMALVVLQITLPALAFLTLDSIVRGNVCKEEFLKKGIIALGITAGFCLLCAVIPSIAGSFEAASDAQQQDILARAFREDRRMLLRSDAWRSLLFIGLAFLCLLWGYNAPQKGNTSSPAQTGPALARRRTGALALCVLIALDLIPECTRYLSAKDFTTPRAFKSQFDLRPVDQLILEDKDPSYRVLDLTTNVFNDSHPSYWHKSIGGYSPAKLQIYQEYIDSHLAPEINSLYRALSSASTVAEAQKAIPELEGLSKLNCRYIILGENNAPLRNPYAKGNAWFEDPENGSIELTSYAPNCLKYSYTSPTGGKAVFSEVYHEGGWKATLDGSGQELEIGLSDEVLRCIDLPAGTHTLEMRFCPSSYKQGEKTSRACSAGLILVVLLALGLMAVPCTRSSIDPLP